MRDTTILCQGMSQAEIEKQYFLRATRPNYETTDIPRWLAKSQQFIGTHTGYLDLVYGPLERNRLDYFPTTGIEAKGFILYIHGGYWQRGDKSVYHFCAEPFIKRGFSVAVMNYQMCPDLRLSEIAPQVRQAVAWLWRNAEPLRLPKHNFNIMGHSAGAHLTIEMLCTDWSQQEKDLPKNLIHSGIAVSGIYDFEPILYCSENIGLRLDMEEARIVSPLNRLPASNAPILLAYGLNEPSDMHRQSQDLLSAFQINDQIIECLPIANADHFETVDVLIDEQSELFDKTSKLIS